MQKTVKMTLKGKTFIKKWASEQNIYEFEKEIKPRGSFDPVLGLYTVMCQINVHNVGNSIDFNVFSCSQEKGTCRQRSGKGAIRKIFPLQKPRWEKIKPTISYSASPCQHILMLLVSFERQIIKAINKIF